MKDVSPGFFPPIPVDNDPPKPMYVQLYDWFRSAIISGRLRPGQKVPSSRQLASELKVSRITVLSAFQQLHEILTGAGDTARIPRFSSGSARA
jgi:GntR family transcriptional regulator / MocR family aminotransferase